MTRAAWVLVLALAGGAEAGEHAFFADVTRASGVHFVHQHGGFLMNLPETTGAGVAVFDYDGDGLPDLFFAQGPGGACQLYRNEGGMRFREVALPAGVARHGSAMGVLAVDLDGDGNQDLVVVGYGEPASYYENQGDGTFRERAAAVGLAGDGRFASFVTALDYDHDGRLDLFVGRYTQYDARDWITDPARAGVTVHAMGALATGLAVHAHAPAASTLWRNELPRGFRDVTAGAGLAGARGRSLAAVGADLDDDGWPDLFVANDQGPCALFINRRDGTFADASAAGWVNEVRGSMGLALGDVNDDGRLDLVVTHWYGDYPALYENLGHYHGAPALRFVDRGELSGLADGPADRVGWGAGFVDVDRDGQDDLLIVNGHTHYPPHDWGRLKPLRAELWRRTGPSRFVRVPPAGPRDPLARARVGRGLALGDLDRDGAVDAVITSNNGPAEVWRGTPPRDTAWIGLELVGGASIRDAIGARVTLEDGPRRRVRELAAGESYLSSSSRTQVFGLGRHTGELAARVRWPSGTIETFSGLAANGYRRLVEGTGAPGAIGRVAE